MKKVFIAAIFACTSVTSFAIANEIETLTTIETTVADEFKEISTAEVAKPVLDAIAKDYAGATLEKAYINENKEYKLELVIKKEVKTVYADASGNWINK